MSDTPRTDAEPTYKTGIVQTRTINIDFARQLERELAEAKDKIVQLERELAEAKTKSNDREKYLANLVAANRILAREKIDAERELAEGAI